MTPEGLKAAAREALARVSPRLAALSTLRQPLRDVLPPDLGSLRPDDFVPARTVGHLGIDMREEDQLERAARWGTTLQPLFSDLRADPAINTSARGSDHLHNGWYPTPDAEIYAALIADTRPRRIVEIGGGFSTLIARRAIAHAGIECRLVVVDPEPRTDVAAHADEVLRTPVEMIGQEELALGERSILFVDSSHVARAGGDVPLIFNELVPALSPGTLVHVHDIYIPYDYPDALRRQLYSEQFVLQALLSGAPRYEVVLAAHYMARCHPEAMQRAFSPVVGHDPLHYGAAFWFRVASGEA